MEDAEIFGSAMWVQEYAARLQWNLHSIQGDEDSIALSNRSWTEVGKRVCLTSKFQSVELPDHGVEKALGPETGCRKGCPNQSAKSLGDQAGL